MKVLFLWLGLTPSIGDRCDTVSPLLKTKKTLNDQSDFMHLCPMWMSYKNMKMKSAILYLTEDP